MKEKKVLFDSSSYQTPNCVCSSSEQDANSISHGRCSKRTTILFMPMLLALSVFLFSCATDPSVYKNIDAAAETNNFEAAVIEIVAGQEMKQPIYPPKNSIMLFLDKGLLEFYAGNYEQSAADLLEAERLIQEAYTKSVSQGFMSYIGNDNTKDYPGEDFEDIYINVFNALNFFKKGDIDGALVEIRKLTLSSGKLNALAQKYNYTDPETGKSLQDSLQEQTGGQGDADLPELEKVNFTNSALARYLSALFYMAEGNEDGARIEFDQLQNAFSAQANIYENPIPAAVEEARNVPAGKARLNVIGFTGLSPVKEEEVIAYTFPGLMYGLDQALFKLPKLIERKSSIDRVEVVVGENKFDLELLEDMSSVIEATFIARYDDIKLKTYIRTLIKYTAGVAAAIAVAETQGETLGVITAVAAKKAADASESADIRMSRYLPSKALIGGINLDPGTYNVTVNFYSGGSVVASNEYNDITVNANELNLLDAVSLK